MKIPGQIGEPFAFWLVQEFLISSDDETDEMQPFTNAYTFLMGTVILIAIVIVRLFISR